MILGYLGSLNVSTRVPKCGKGEWMGRVGIRMIQCEEDLIGCCWLSGKGGQEPKDVDSL